MKFRLNKTDIYLILLYFTFAVLLALLSFDDYGSWRLLIADQLSYIALTGVSVYVIVFILFNQFFPKGQFLLLFVTLLVFFTIIGSLWIKSYCYIFGCEENPLNLTGIYTGIVQQVNQVGLLATILLGKKLYDARFRFTKLEKEKKESELRFLKSQIDPHFLFNNLNTVDALIDADPKVAKVYLNKLSQLYRYLISSKDREVVLLSEELEFARNYFYLIEIRYGDAFQFDVVSEVEEMDNLLIPPGALQTLLENIVKHNEANAGYPLKITIRINENGIIVSNDLRRKQTNTMSTGIGLTNLRSRYQLLTDADIKISHDDRFVVELPTIKQVA